MFYLHKYPLAKHAKMCGIIQNKVAVQLASSTLHAVELYRQNIERCTYDQRGNLKASIMYGKYWRQDKSQRRLIKRTYPTKPPGRPSNNEIVVLVSFIATAFRKATGNPVTLYYEGQLDSAGNPIYSPFEKFISPIMEKLQIKNHRDWLSHHFSERKKEVHTFK